MPESVIDASPDLVWKVAFNVPLWATFDYRPADDRAVSESDLGRRVRAPFGRGGQDKVGMIVATGPATVASVATAELLDPDTPLIAGELWKSLQWLQRYTHSPFGEILWQALPKPLRDGEPAVPAPMFAIAASGSAESLRNGKPREALESLMAVGPVTEMDARALMDATTLRNLLSRELATRQEIPTADRHAQLDALAKAWVDDTNHPLHRLTLNAEQAQAVEQIAADTGRYQTTLLEGVTGSGKTEVYLQLIAQCIARGEQALILVPEIGLTPQTLRRFEDRLGVPVDAIHSGLADSARADVWLRARAGLSRVIVGTRSAVFLPLAKPGLMIVDEEHDSSFKQFDGIRYNARDFLVQRAHRLGIPLVLGSATPSLESLHNALSGKYRLLQLSARAGAALPPQMRPLDLKGVTLEAGLSPHALSAIGHRLARGEQVLVFKNRRGYAPVLLCHDCGWSAQCERCDSPMTVHGGGRRLQCHHCGASRQAPPACPDCGGLALMPQGVGTERLEEYLDAQFGALAPVVRIDRGTTQTREGLQQQLAIVGDGPGVLVGTQMLAKGHDLPNLTLVIVVGADEGLFSADFRSHERLAQLLVQVAGRAGRADKPGEVLIQTHHPENELLQTLLRGGYTEFSRAALDERRLAGWPPFSSLALIRAEAKHVADVRDFLRALLAEFSAYTEILPMGPLPAPMPRRAGFLREQLLLQADTRSQLHAALSAVIPAAYSHPAARRVRWSLDVDPYDLY